MKNRIYDTLNDIKAEDELKNETFAFLQKKITKKNRFHIKKLAAVLASVFIILLAGGLSYSLYYSASAYVDIDMNPSIELTLNRFNRVIKVYAYNDDGNEIISGINLKHKLYDEALKILIDEMTRKGYINDDDLFSVTLQTNNNKNDILNAIKTTVTNTLKLHHSTLEQNIFTVDSYTKTHSHEKNITPAKYLAILELQAVNPTVTFENCKNHTISDLKQQTHDHKNDDHSGEHGSHRNCIGNPSDKTHENTGE